MSNSLKRFLQAALLLTALVLKTGTATAQQPGISGWVVDNEGYPVIGAAVIIDGTSTGTTTGIDGEFTLEMEEGTAITVTCIGYTDVKTTYVPGMTITMQIESTLLDDVVVVAYGVQKKETLTGAISVVKDEILEEKGALSSRPAILCLRETSPRETVPGISALSARNSGRKVSGRECCGMTMSILRIPKSVKRRKNIPKPWNSSAKSRHTTTTSDSSFSAVTATATA